MKRASFAIALLASLVACATTPAVGPDNTPTPIERADTALERAEAAYDRIKLFADVLRPYLPASYQQRIADAEGAAGRAFAAARAAVLLADQLAELRKAEAEIDKITAITGAQ